MPSPLSIPRGLALPAWKGRCIRAQVAFFGCNARYASAGVQIGFQV